MEDSWARFFTRKNITKTFSTRSKFYFLGWCPLQLSASRTIYRQFFYIILWLGGNTIENRSKMVISAPRTIQQPSQTCVLFNARSVSLTFLTADYLHVTHLVDIKTFSREWALNSLKRFAASVRGTWMWQWHTDYAAKLTRPMHWKSLALLNDYLWNRRVSD